MGDLVQGKPLDFCKISLFAGDFSSPWGPAGYEVSEGSSKAYNSLRLPNASDNSTRPSNGNDEIFADVPFIGMFDEQSFENQFKNYVNRVIL